MELKFKDTLRPFSGETARCPKCLDIITTTWYRKHNDSVEYLDRICDCGFNWQENVAPEGGSEDEEHPGIGTLLVMLSWVADNPDIWDEMPLPLKIGLQKNFPKFDWPEPDSASTEADTELSEAQKEMYKGWMEGHGMAFGGPQDA